MGNVCCSQTDLVMPLESHVCKQNVKDCLEIVSVIINDGCRNERVAPDHAVNNTL